MSIPKTPIIIAPRSMIGFLDSDDEPLDEEQIARDLTELYEMKRRQEECGKTGHNRTITSGKFIGYSEDGHAINEMIIPSNCSKCGADLTKGATHES